MRPSWSLSASLISCSISSSVSWLFIGRHTPWPWDDLELTSFRHLCNFGVVLVLNWSADCLCWTARTLSLALRRGRPKSLTSVWPHCDPSVTSALALRCGRPKRDPSLTPVWTPCDPSVTSALALRRGRSSGGRTLWTPREPLPPSRYSGSSWPSCWGTPESQQFRCLPHTSSSTAARCTSPSYQRQLSSLD